MKKTVLVVDDNQDVLRLVESSFKNTGYTLIAAGDGEGALTMVQEKQPDIVILDLLLPSISGLDVCRTLRGNPDTSKIPILMLSARHDEIDRVVGFEVGADDYVAKPFSPRELVLRVQALLRRCGDWRKAKAASKASKITHEAGVARIGPIELDYDKFEVRVDGKTVEFSRTEFKLLSILMERAGKVLSREVLLNEVWGYENNAETRTVDMHMLRLREKLGREADCLVTVRGFGYLMSTSRTNGA